MSKDVYEVEIKSLLGSKDRADELLKKLKSFDPNLELIAKGKQLNHYFNSPKDLSSLETAITPYIAKEKIESLQRIVKEGNKISVRTRDADGKVSFVIKASVNDHSSSNGVTRIEFEERVSMILAELDGLLLKAGLTYQAKWSREREEYQTKDTHICLDKNAGYGYLAEFERVVDDKGMLEETRVQLEDFMESLGVVELSQERIERMFAHYNAHWPEYYGTDKIFIIE